MTDFEKVIDFDNMYRAYRRSRRGKGYKRRREVWRYGS